MACGTGRAGLPFSPAPLHFPLRRSLRVLPSVRFEVVTVRSELRQLNRPAAINVNLIHKRRAHLPRHTRKRIGLSANLTRAIQLLIEKHAEKIATAARLTATPPLP